MLESCFHCGTTTAKVSVIAFDEKSFCCLGCKTIYQFFSDNELADYYRFGDNPGAKPADISSKYNFLQDESIVSTLLEFQDEETNIITLYIPHIHCSSCIWILEHLHKIIPGVVSSTVNFPKKSVRIIFQNQVKLYDLVSTLATIGYEPHIRLENLNTSEKPVDRSLLYRIGVAFFSFGNIMLLSFPEYFEVGEYWLEHYKMFFRWLMLALSLPAFLYAAFPYYKSAFHSLRNGQLNMDVPIALGIVAMFIRSIVDMYFDHGAGFFDSMCGLIFFMLLGKLFQQKTYEFLSFERDYKSYFPIAVTRINDDNTESSVSVYDAKPGDCLLIRNEELMPVDGILISNQAKLDYSFVTGEQKPVYKKAGDKLFAGGKFYGPTIQIRVLKSMSNSYLTQLWANEAFNKSHKAAYRGITDRVSRYFTPVLLSLAVVAFIAWSFVNIQTAFQVLTAVLIVACPCALALTAPFTLGNVLRILGYQKLYLKNASVIEQMAGVTTLVFDKTGTITTTSDAALTWNGNFSATELELIKSAVHASNHPLSRMISQQLKDVQSHPIQQFEEIAGKGISAKINETDIRVGSESWITGEKSDRSATTEVHVAIDGQHKGYVSFATLYREQLSELFEELSKTYKIVILSGDNASELTILEKMLPKDVSYHFNQKPEQKLAFIKNLQENGERVLMMGDGLNDAGALMQSNVGLAISENINVFSPACDGILDATVFSKMHYFLRYSKNAMRIIYASFVISILYNAVGLSFALSGTLSPLIAAIIMPLSTVTIVSFVTVMSNVFAKFKK